MGRRRTRRKSWSVFPRGRSESWPGSPSSTSRTTFLSRNGRCTTRSGSSGSSETCSKTATTSSHRACKYTAWLSRRSRRGARGSLRRLSKRWRTRDWLKKRRTSPSRRRRSSSRRWRLPAKRWRSSEGILPLLRRSWRTCRPTSKRWKGRWLACEPSSLASKQPGCRGHLGMGGVPRC